jgi:hypothetical protein
VAIFRPALQRTSLLRRSDLASEKNKVHRACQARIPQGSGSLQWQAAGTWRLICRRGRSSNCPSIAVPRCRVAGISEHQACSRQSLSLFHHLPAEPRWHCCLCGRQLFTPSGVLVVPCLAVLTKRPRATEGCINFKFSLRQWC